MGALPADALRLRDERDRRLAAGGALRGDAHAPEDPRGDGALRARSPASAARARSATSRTCSTRPAGLQGATYGYTGIVVAALAPLQPVRGLPRRRPARRAAERRLLPPGRRLPDRPRRRDAGDHPLLHARRRAADPLPGADRPAARRAVPAEAPSCASTTRSSSSCSTQAVVYGTPILFAALGELLAERSGVLNLGVEGMMLVGAVMGFWTVQRAPGPEAVALALAVLTAAFAALVMALILAFLVDHAAREPDRLGPRADDLRRRPRALVVPRQRPRPRRRAADAPFGDLDVFGLEDVPVVGPIALRPVGARLRLVGAASPRSPLPVAHAARA